MDIVLINELKKLKGFYLRGDRIWIRGSINKKEYRFSLDMQLTKVNLQWCRRQSIKSLLIDFVAKENIEGKSRFLLKNSLKEFGLRVIENKSKTISTETLKDYRRVLIKYIVPYFDENISNIKAIHIDEWQNKLLEKVSADRFRRIKNVLSMILKKAESSDIIVKNPVKATELIYDKTLTIEEKEKKELRSHFTAGEVQKILTHSTGWLKVYVNLFFVGGFRNGEINGLRWKDIDFQSNCIFLKGTFTKGEFSTTNSKKNHYRTVPIPKYVMSLLEDYYNERRSDNFLFVNNRGEPFYDSKNIAKYSFYPLLEKLGIEKKPLKGFRKSFVTVMLDSGQVSLKTIQEIVGHKINSRVTIDNYYKKSNRIINISGINDVYSSITNTAS